MRARITGVAKHGVIERASEATRIHAHLSGIENIYIYVYRQDTEREKEDRYIYIYI